MRDGNVNQLRVSARSVTTPAISTAMAATAAPALFWFCCRAFSRAALAISAIAFKDLETKMPAITARALARAVLKAQMAKAARENARQQNQNNPRAAVAAMAVEIAGVVTERADTRSWLTLPSRIHLARLPLPPGTYTVKVNLLGDDGQIVSTQEYANMDIRRGAKTYLSPHWIPSTVTPPRRSR